MMAMPSFADTEGIAAQLPTAASNRLAPTPKPSSSRNGSIMIAGQIVKFGLHTVGMLALSRLLAPDDFGLVAMVTVFVALGGLIRDFGLSSAALRAPRLTSAQATNLFWINSALGSAMGLVFVGASPLVVMLYDEPRLGRLMPMLALALMFSGMQTQLQVSLARTGRVTALISTDIAGQALALAVAILLAVAGAGYIALAAQLVVAPLVMLVSRWRVTRWRPRRFTRRAGTLALLREGRDFGVASFINFIATNVDSITVGAAMGAVPLGLYNRANQLLTGPVGQLMSPLVQVVVPASNREIGFSRRTQFLLQVQGAVCLPMAFVFAFVIGTSPTLVPFLLGDQWSAAGPILRILSVGGMFWVFTQVSFWAFLALAPSRDLLHYQFIAKGVMIAGIVVSSQFTLTAVAVTYAATLVFGWFLTLWWLRRRIAYPSMQFLASGLRYIIAGLSGAVTAGIVLAGLTARQPSIQLALAATAALSVFTLAVVAFPSGRRELQQLLATVNTALRKMRSAGGESGG